jgi:mRNA interferase MazF
VVLISRNESYAVRTYVIVAQVTTRVRGIDSEVPLGPADGLPRPCAANMDTIHTILNTRLHRYVATLRPAKMEALDAALRFALGLKEPA